VSHRNRIWERLNNLALFAFLLLLPGWALVQLLAYFEAVIVIFGFAAILAFAQLSCNGYIVFYLTV